MNRTLRQSLVVLAARERTRQQSYGTRDFDCHDQIRRVHGFEPIQEAALEALFDLAPERGEVYAWKTWLFLPAPERGPLRIPVLNVIYDYVTNPARVSMQAGIFYPTEHGVLAAGWRFETPETSGVDGRPSTHGYYHAQSGNAVRTLLGDLPLPVADERLPTGQPTFPLDAADEVDLLVCLLISIYGLREASELIRATGGAELAARLAALRCVR